jgi:hypothetical protein
VVVPLGVYERFDRSASEYVTSSGETNCLLLEQYMKMAEKIRAVDPQVRCAVVDCE